MMLNMVLIDVIDVIDVIGVPGTRAFWGLDTRRAHSELTN